MHVFAVAFDNEYMNQKSKIKKIKYLNQVIKRNEEKSEVMEGLRC